MKGKIAQVACSTSGIGRGMAGVLAEAGADVMLHGLGAPADFEHLRAGLARRTGARVAVRQADLSRAEEVIRLVRDSEAALGGIDILINNAGVQFVSPVGGFPLERWSAVQNIILNSSSNPECLPAFFQSTPAHTNYDDAHFFAFFSCLRRLVTPPCFRPAPAQLGGG